MKEDNNEKDVFHDAAMNAALENALSEGLKEKEDDKKEDDDDDKKALLAEVEKRVVDGDSQWDILNKMISGGFTDRFIKAMIAMPDKDFVRNYLKVIEHFKPKLTRSEGAREDQPDTIINIQTMIINKNGEKVVKVLNIEEDGK
jgi:ABC-type transporter MlaC component